MIFIYKAIDKEGSAKAGMIDSFSIDAAISSLQKQGLVISSIKPKDEKNDLRSKIPFFNRVSNKDIVILSRQMSTLFEAKVSALRIFRLISSEAENRFLRDGLVEVADDLQGGTSISEALSRHPKIFSDFYVNMVKSGEESGKLDEVFAYLADYLDRTYEVTSKAKNALVYPAFVVFTFFAVMILMFTVIIPKIALIVKDSAAELPIYTKLVFGFSGFLVNHGFVAFFGVLFLIGLLIWYARTPVGRKWISNFRLQLPYLGNLYRKLYLSRFADNMSTMIVSGIPMLKAIEVTASIIDNDVYKAIMKDAFVKVKTGSSLSEALDRHKEIPTILVQMVKIGEESGELGSILKTMAKFYQREVMNAVDTLVGLIEPVMIVALGVGVGVLLASVLMPIYDIASSAA
ncbi:MAG: type II secretion system F family protein [Patescibacteria group bacterium]